MAVTAYDLARRANELDRLAGEVPKRHSRYQEWVHELLVEVKELDCCRKVVIKDRNRRFQKASNQMLSAFKAAGLA